MTTIQFALRQRRANRKKGGFTLIEILVVIVIIALLAGTIGPAVVNRVGEAKTATARDQIAAFSAALEQYKIDTGHYPSTAQGLDALLVMPSIDTPTNWRGPYLQKNVIPTDPWQIAYYYESPGTINPNKYDLYTLGKDGQPGGQETDPDNEDITSWN